MASGRGCPPSRERPSSPPSTARHLRLDRRQLGAECAAGRPAPRRPGAAGRAGDQPTAPSVSASAANTPRAILPSGRLPPQPRPASRTRAMNASSPRAASRAGSPAAPRRHHLQAASQVTTRTAAAQVSRRRPGHRQEVPDPLHRRRRPRDQLLAAPPKLPQMRPRLVQLLRDVAVQLAASRRDQHASDSSRLCVV